MQALLRPLRLGEILDRAVYLYRQNFLKFIGIVALVQVPITLAQIAISITAFSDTFAQLGNALNNPAAAPENPFSVFGPAYFAGASLNSLVSIVGFILLQGVATAALTRAVIDSYFGESQPSVWEAYRRVRSHWFPIVAALLMAVAIAIAVAFWWLIPCFGWLTGGGMLLFLWYVIVPMLAPIIILEDTSPASAWRRAWSLARRRFWWVLGFAVVLYVFNLIVVAGPAAIVSVGGQFLFGDPLELNSQRFTFQTVVQSLTILITGVLYLPLQVASMTLLYLDLRVRTEGLDLLLSIENKAPAHATLLPVTASRVGGQDEALLTGIDWRNFVVLTVGVIAALLILYALLVGVAIALIAALGA